MLPEKELEEIRTQLAKSENPLFFYDDDCDGLCSYLLLKKHIDRGKGIIVKSAPELRIQYLKKVKELCPDRVFVLDKASISQDFVDGAHAPITWIDHHTPVDIKGVKYYNPRKQDPDIYMPTSQICYDVVKENIWIATCGTIADWALPPFLEEFKKQYPGLIDDPKDPGDALYQSELGKLIRMLSFILKGQTSEVNKCINILLKIESPYEILNQLTPRGKYIYKRFEKINKEYEELVKKVKDSVTKDKLLIFYYPTIKTSFTGELANELSYRYPDKIIIIGRERHGDMRMSLRSKTIKLPKIINNALEGLEGYGGGHELACGANISTKDLDTFIKRLKAQI